MIWSRQLEEQLRTTAKLIISDNIPPILSGPHLAISVPSSTVGINAAGIVTHVPFILVVLREHFNTVIQPILDNHVQREAEMQYSRKLLIPRSVRIGHVYQQAIEGLYNPISLQSLIPDEEFSNMVYAVAMALGYGKHICQVRAYDVPAPKNNASSGFTYDGHFCRVSSKGDLWHKYQMLAEAVLIAANEDEFLDIDRVLDIHYLMEVVQKYRLYFVMLSRLDGGPHKSRLLFAGSAIIYILESMFLGCDCGGKIGLSLDVANSPHIATTGGKVRSFLDAYDGEWLLSDDISGWDLSWFWRYLVLALVELCRIYCVPERVAVLIIASNVAGSIIVDCDGRLCIKEVHGRIRSGTGAFAKLNHLLRAVTIYYLQQKLGHDPLDIGVVFGDDAAFPLQPSEIDYADELLRRCFNIRMKLSDQIVSKLGVLMCRRVFLHHRDYSTPVVNSVVRNIIFPEFLIDPRDIWTLCLRVRSQLANLENAAYHDKAWLSVYLSIIDNIVPERLLMVSIPDEDISRYASAEAREAFKYAKRMF